MSCTYEENPTKNGSGEATLADKAILGNRGEDVEERIWTWREPKKNPVGNSMEPPFYAKEMRAILEC